MPSIKQNEEQFKQISSKLEQIATHNRILETQIAQQAFSSIAKPLGKLPSQPEYAQKETCQAITLRSGKEAEGSSSKKKIIVDDNEEVGVKEREVSGTKKDESKMKNEKEDITSPRVDIRTLPFPQRYIRRNLDKQFGKFLDYLKEITISNSFRKWYSDSNLL